MMTSLAAKKFLEDNYEALKLLSERLRRIDTVKGCKDEAELKGRQRAIEIVSGWMLEIFGISQEQLDIPSDEDNLYIHLVQGRGEEE